MTDGPRMACSVHTKLKPHRSQSAFVRYQDSVRRRTSATASDSNCCLVFTRALAGQRTEVPLDIAGRKSGPAGRLSHEQPTLATSFRRLKILMKMHLDMKARWQKPRQRTRQGKSLQAELRGQISGGKWCSERVDLENLRTPALIWPGLSTQALGCAESTCFGLSSARLCSTWQWPGASNEYSPPQ